MIRPTAVSEQQKGPGELSIAFGIRVWPDTGLGWASRWWQRWPRL